MLRAHNIQVKRDGKLALQVEDLSFVPGEITAILGPNGAGKSTLLSVLSGGLQPLHGVIILNDHKFSEYKLAARAQILAVLSQKNDIPFPLTVLEVVLLGRTPHTTTHSENLKIARQSLQQVDMLPNAQRFYPKLSGGEQQRVQIARVLAQFFSQDNSTTRYLILDEPTAALDLSHQHLILQLLRSLVTLNTSIILVLHDLNLAMQYADRVIVIQEGKTVAIGTPTAILNKDLLATVFNLSVTLLPYPQLPGKNVIIPLGLVDLNG